MGGRVNARDGRGLGGTWARRHWSAGSCVLGVFQDAAQNGTLLTEPHPPVGLLTILDLSPGRVALPCSSKPLRCGTGGGEEGSYCRLATLHPERTSTSIQQQRSPSSSLLLLLSALFSNSHTVAMLERTSSSPPPPAVLLARAAIAPHPPPPPPRV